MSRRLAHIGYALPALPLAALYLPVFSYIVPFYAAERDVALGALGTALILIRLFDAVSDPAIGWLSDRTPGAWARRLWLVAAVPLIMAATWAVFVPPESAGLAHAVLWLAALTLGWTMAQTPYVAWGAELEDSYDGRTRVTAWREALVLLGTLAATLLYVLGGEGGAGLAAVALLVVLALPVTVAAACLMAGEPRRPARRLSLAEGARAMAANAPFRRLLLAWFVNGAANGLPVTLFVFFVGHRLQAPEAVGALLLAYFAAAVGGVPLWVRIAGRMPKHRAWAWGMIYACAVFASVFWLEPGDVAGFAVISVLTGLALGADLALPPSIQADVVETDRLATGAARAGLFFALWQVATKAALALSSGTALILLGAAGFVPTAAVGASPPEAMAALTWLYAGVPIALKLVAIGLMWRFPLDRDRLEALRAAQPA
ncbi:MFS transporter [Paralimibaculum aggregatum]|uniref:MFS transporter n=1 Tax=Paralimibaculum aggregatum TaxID=3036245 RepID=A0ABQ6LRX3_9RHOB|nr:MFS transporter [Limibaculum sp. NKW23]GMG84728.1 MFS transporter [Limibaculum sp. NKW23]